MSTSVPIRRYERSSEPPQHVAQTRFNQCVFPVCFTGKIFKSVPGKLIKEVSPSFLCLLTLVLSGHVRAQLVEMDAMK